MKSTFWMTAQEAEDEIKSRESWRTRDAKTYEEAKQALQKANERVCGSCGRIKGDHFPGDGCQIH